MTEDEAKTKWCPFARVLAQDAERKLQGQAASNRIDWVGGQPQMPVGSACVASVCMAWRTPFLWTEDDGSTQPNDGKHGFCGLAGKP
jgi:hypothetical protein